MPTRIVNGVIVKDGDAPPSDSSAASDANEGTALSAVATSSGFLSFEERSSALYDHVLRGTVDVLGNRVPVYALALAALVAVVVFRLNGLVFIVIGGVIYGATRALGSEGGAGGSGGSGVRYCTSTSRARTTVVHCRTHTHRCGSYCAVWLLYADGGLPPPSALVWLSSTLAALEGDRITHRTPQHAFY